MQALARGVHVNFTLEGRLLDNTNYGNRLSIFLTKYILKRKKITDSLFLLALRNHHSYLTELDTVHKSLK